MLIHAVMMLQDKVMKESVRDRRDVPESEAAKQSSRNSAGH
jgi:hypothetical protein